MISSSKPFGPKALGSLQTAELSPLFAERELVTISTLPSSNDALGPRTALIFQVGAFTFVPLVASVAWLAGNAIWISVATSASFALIGLFGGRIQGTYQRSLLAIALVGQAIAVTIALSGKSWQVDSHMLFFALLACCVALHEVRALFVAAGLIVIHHLSLSVLVPALVYPPDTPLLNISRTLLHGAVVAIEVGILAGVIRTQNRLRREAAKQTQSVMESQQATKKAKAKVEAAVVQAEEQRVAAEKLASEMAAAKAKVEEQQRHAAEIAEQARAAEAIDDKYRAQAHAAQDQVVDSLRQCLARL